MALILLNQYMINPNEFNFISVHCYLPSGMFSGALIQFFTYLQNLNFRQFFIKHLSAVGENPSIHFVRIAVNKMKHSIPIPLELLRLQRRNDKKDFQSW